MASIAFVPSAVFVCDKYVFNREFVCFLSLHSYMHINKASEAASSAHVHINFIYCILASRFPFHLRDTLMETLIPPLTIDRPGKAKRTTCSYRDGIRSVSRRVTRNGLRKSTQFNAVTNMTTYTTPLQSSQCPPPVLKTAFHRHCRPIICGFKWLALYVLWVS